MNKYSIYILFLLIGSIHNGQAQQHSSVDEMIVETKGNYEEEASSANNADSIGKINDDSLYNQLWNKYSIVEDIITTIPQNNKSQKLRPAQYTIDKSKGVGEIPIQQGIVNGALTLSIPIEVHPGRNGFQPNLSLNYNSFNSNGMAGIGWDLGGFSSISLINNSIYFDGFAATKMNKDGVFALVGMEIIL